MTTLREMESKQSLSTEAPHMRFKGYSVRDEAGTLSFPANPNASGPPVPHLCFPLKVELQQTLALTKKNRHVKEMITKYNVRNVTK